MGGFELLTTGLRACSAIARSPELRAFLTTHDDLRQSAGWQALDAAAPTVLSGAGKFMRQLVRRPPAALRMTRQLHATCDSSRVPRQWCKRTSRPAPHWQAHGGGSKVALYIWSLVHPGRRKQRHAPLHSHLSGHPAQQVFVTVMSHDASTAARPAGGPRELGAAARGGRAADEPQPRRGAPSARGGLQLPPQVVRCLVLSACAMLACASSLRW
jgi:hypothetical protein